MELANLIRARSARLPLLLLSPGEDVLADKGIEVRRLHSGFQFGDALVCALWIAVKLDLFSLGSEQAAPVHCAFEAAQVLDPAARHFRRHSPSVGTKEA